MKNDLIRRSELLAKKCMVRGHLDTGSPCPSKVVAVPVDVIERAKAVDAVPVVRCKDCLSGKLNTYWGGYNCRHQNGKLMNDSDYCSYGERRDDHGNAER